MKKNKTILIIAIILTIILVQPENFIATLKFFSHNDLKMQVGATEKDLSQTTQKTLDYQSSVNQLKKIFYDGGEQKVTVNLTSNFSEDELDLSNGTWSKNSAVDLLDRVGAANAMLGVDSLRGSSVEKNFGHIWPSGFNHDVSFYIKKEMLPTNALKSDNVLTVTKNLEENMLYYEQEIFTYIQTTKHHVRYRVTPIFDKVDLLAKGVRLEAKSVEDDGLSFDVYLFNVQEGHRLDYLTGKIKK